VARAVQLLTESSRLFLPPPTVGGIGRKCVSPLCTKVGLFRKGGTQIPQLWRINERNFPAAAYARDLEDIQVWWIRSRLGDLVGLRWGSAAIGWRHADRNTILACWISLVY